MKTFYIKKRPTVKIGLDHNKGNGEGKPDKDRYFP